MKNSREVLSTALKFIKDFRRSTPNSYDFLFMEDKMRKQIELLTFYYYYFTF